MVRFHISSRSFEVTDGKEAIGSSKLSMTHHDVKIHSLWHLDIKTLTSIFKLSGHEVQMSVGRLYRPCMNPRVCLTSSFHELVCLTRQVRQTQ